MNYRFFDFHERYDQWVDADGPSVDFRFWVMAWLFRLQDDPRVDAAPADELGEPWWFARIPHAEDDAFAIVCLYAIDGEEVRCSCFTTLRKPI